MSSDWRTKRHTLVAVLGFLSVLGVAWHAFVSASMPGERSARGRGSTGAPRQALRQTPSQSGGEGTGGGVEVPEGSRSDAQKNGEVSDRPEQHEQLPAVFFGDVRIAGHVTDARGPVPGAKVHCAVDGFDDRSRAVLARFSVTTSADGKFEWTDLPRAAYYRLSATHGYRLGVAELSAGPREDVTVRLRDLTYIRLQFVTNDGLPVDGHGIAPNVRITGPSRKAPIAESASVYDESAARESLASMGIDDPGTIDDYWAIYSQNFGKSGIPEDSSIEVSIEVLGFRKASRSVPLRGLAAWPSATRIELEREPIPSDRLIYEVEMPAIEWPSDWPERESREFLFLDEKESGLTHVVTRGANRFLAARGMRFRIRALIHSMEGNESIPYRLEETGGLARIVPEFPRVGFVTILVDPISTDPGPSERFLVQGRSDLRAYSPWPGVLHVGPLPLGRAFIAAWTGEARVKPECIFEFDVRRNHQTIRWRR